jgi:hypothetical protein
MLDGFGYMQGKGAEERCCPCRFSYSVVDSRDNTYSNVDIDSNFENVDLVLPNSAGSCGTIYALNERTLIGSLRLNPRYCLFVKHVADHYDRHDKENRWCGVAAWKIWGSGWLSGRKLVGVEKVCGSWTWLNQAFSLFIIYHLSLNPLENITRRL